MTFYVFWVIAHVFSNTVCKALSTLSPKTVTVAENGDCRRKRREKGDSRRFRQQSHFSAIVAENGDKYKLSPFVAEIGDSMDRF